MGDRGRQRKRNWGKTDSQVKQRSSKTKRHLSEQRLATALPTCLPEDLCHPRWVLIPMHSDYPAYFMVCQSSMLLEIAWKRISFFQPTQRSSSLVLLSLKHHLIQWDRGAGDSQQPISALWPGNKGIQVTLGRKDWGGRGREGFH
jgi:hypothetical protein